MKLNEQEVLILKTILENKDNSAVASIEGRADYIFTSEETLGIYDSIDTYYNKFDNLPDYNQLETILRVNKKNNLLEALKEVQEFNYKEKIAKPIIEVKLQEYAKNKALTITNDIRNSLKSLGYDKVRETLQVSVDKISKIISDSNPVESKQALMYGDRSVERFKKRYERAKKTGGSIIAKFGIDRIDDALGGYSRSDMINVGGFTNQGKSPLLRYLAYNALQQGLNVVFVPLETGQEETENFFYTLHANNYKKFGNNIPRITNKKIRNGKLTKKEEDYLISCIEDFNHNGDGSLYILRPQDSQYCMDNLMSDLRKINNTLMEVDVLVLDYLSLLRPNSIDTYIDKSMINLMHTRMRQEMVNFDNGRGFIYMGAFQMNRKGYLDMLADKEHLYDLTAVGDYNAIERDSTIMLSIARTNEDEQARLARIQSLKCRDDKKFQPFTITFDGETGNFLGTTDNISEEDALEELEELEI